MIIFLSWAKDENGKNMYNVSQSVLVSILLLLCSSTCLINASTDLDLYITHKREDNLNQRRIKRGRVNGKIVIVIKDLELRQVYSVTSDWT